MTAPARSARTLAYLPAIPVAAVTPTALVILDTAIRYPASSNDGIGYLIVIGPLLSGAVTLLVLLPLAIVASRRLSATATAGALTAAGGLGHFAIFTAIAADFHHDMLVYSAFGALGGLAFWTVLWLARRVLR